MATDYSSTARALASPITSPISEAPTRSSFNRIRSSRRRLSIRDDRLSYKAQFFRGAEMVQRKVWSTYKAMTLIQKLLAVIALIIIGVLGILFLIYNHQVYEWLKPVADKWRNIPGGRLILFTIIFVCAFPPVIGYSTALTIAGFLYGFPNGWFVAAAANVLGSLASFVACKTFLSNYVHKLVGEDKRFAALALVLKHDGLKILVMIRLCPLPYSLSNGAMATFPTVSPLSFTLATALATPKLFIHVFIGSRFADLVERGAEMDIVTRIVNYASIAAGGLLGIGLGYYIYQRTVARAQQLELEESQRLTRTPGSGGSGDGYFETPLDDPEAFAAEGMDDDDISLWDNEEDGYRDASPDTPAVVAGGYVDEEASIGTKGSKDIGK
jgi:uncharacterized membrane protein YdjX (TVP38/TMEM64 family)